MMPWLGIFRRDYCAPPTTREKNECIPETSAVKILAVLEGEIAKLAAASDMIGGKSKNRQDMQPWTMFVIGVYVGAALVTLGFQTWMRLEECSGIGPCMVSLLKGVVWSVIWPVSWPVFVTGRLK